MAIFGGSSYGGNTSYGGLANARNYNPMAANNPYATNKPTDPLTNQYKLYNTAVEQQAGDYSNIMQGYKNLASKGPSSANAQAVSNLGDLATTGGYSEADKADIRARGVSPIRSVYAGANRDVDRQKGLQGGYSPNYGAVKAKMAREQSEQVAGGVQNVNAMLAQNIAGNRLNAAGSYASASNQQDNTALNALQGQASLYGSTPGMASLYGGQALQGAQLQNNINQQGVQNRNQMTEQFIRGLGGR